MEDFGSRLKTAMEEKKMSASELSRASGVGKNLISYYIHGRCLAKQDKVYMLARALDVNPGWLMTGVEQDDAQELPVFIPNTENWSKAIRFMDPDDYKTVLEIFKKAFDKMEKKGIKP